MQLLLSDGETETQNGFMTLSSRAIERVRTASSSRFPTSGAQLPKTRAGVGVVGCSNMMLQRLQDTVTSGGQDPWLAQGNEAVGESPVSLKSHPGTRAPW